MGSPIVAAWLENAVIANRGVTGCLTLIPGESLSRKDVLNNCMCIIPILKYMGMRPSIDMLSNEVAAFFQLSRPRGKAPVKSDLASTYVVYMLASCTIDAQGNHTNCR